MLWIQIIRSRKIFLTYKKLLSPFKNLQLISDSKNIKNGCWANVIVFKKETNLKSKNIIQKMHSKNICNANNHCYAKESAPQKNAMQK